MRIVNATKEHLDTVLEIEKKSFTMPWSKDSFKAELDMGAHFTVSEEESGQITGFCILRASGEEAELFHIAVLPEYRRRHTAEMLLMEALHYARSKKADSVYLEVRQSNFAARGLYEKCGFEEIGIRRGYYDFPNEDAVIMICRPEDEL